MQYSYMPNSEYTQVINKGKFLEATKIYIQIRITFKKKQNQH